MDDEPGSDTRLTLTLDWPEITLEKLSRVASLWANLVQSVSTAAVGKRQAVKWVISDVHFGSPLVLEATPESRSERIDPIVIRTISHAVVNGMEHLEKRPDAPEFFSGQSLGIAKKMSLLADSQQQRRIFVSNGAGPVELTPRTAATVNDIFGPVVESYGSVEGQLEGVLTHGKRRFYVYESLTGKQVRCLFDYSVVSLNDILKAYEKRVSVSGMLRSKAVTGERLSIEVAQFSLFDPDDTLPSTDDILRMWSGHQ